MRLEGIQANIRMEDVQLEELCIEYVKKRPGRSGSCFVASEAGKVCARCCGL